MNRKKQTKSNYFVVNDFIDFFCAFPFVSYLLANFSNMLPTMFELLQVDLYVDSYTSVTWRDFKTKEMLSNGIKRFLPDRYWTHGLGDRYI